MGTLARNSLMIGYDYLVKTITRLVPYTLHINPDWCQTHGVLKKRPAQNIILPLHGELIIIEGIRGHT